MRKSTLSKILWFVVVTATMLVASGWLYLVTNQWVREASRFPRGVMAAIFVLPMFVWMWAQWEMVIVDSEFINYTHGRYWLALGKAALLTIVSVMAAFLFILLVHNQCS